MNQGQNTAVTPERSSGPDIWLTRANGTRRILRPEARCDRALKGGNRAKQLCNAAATHYDAATAQNLCGIHARDTKGATFGRGRSWYETPCANHADRAATTIGGDDVARCGICSYEHAIATPGPVIDEAYWAGLAAGAFS